MNTTEKTLCQVAPNGRELQNFCEIMKLCLEAKIFEEDTMTATVTDEILDTKVQMYRIAIRTNNRLKKKAELSFCPFCGVFIDTQDYGLNKTELIGRVFKHHKGGVYIVVREANVGNSADAKFPETVVYQNVNTREVFARKKVEFLEKFTLLEGD